MNEGIFACRRHFLNAALFSALLNLTMLAPTLYMLQVYDRVVPTRGFGTLLWLTGIFTFSILTLSALDFVRSRLLIRAASRLDRLLGPRLLRLLLSHRGSARNSAALREFDALRQTVSGPAVIAIFDAPWTPIYVAICFLIHPALGVLSLLGALLLAGMAWLSEAATRNQIAKSIELSTKSYVAIDQSMAAAPVLHALGMAPALLARRLAERRRKLHRLDLYGHLKIRPRHAPVLGSWRRRLARHRPKDFRRRHLRSLSPRRARLESD